MKNLLIISCFFLTFCTPKEVTTNETAINIDVNQNHEVFLNGQLINLEDISQKLIDITSNDTINKTDHYIINLSVDKSINNELITDIKQQLRKAHMLKLKFSTN